MKRLVVFLLTFAVLFSLSSCTNVEKKDLTIYVSKDDYAWATAVETYKTAHPELSMNIVSFDTYDALETRLMSELPAGGGPDVILVNRMASPLDLRKLAANNRLLPLDDLFAGDESFDRDRYFAPVLDAGKIGEVQYTVPIGFSVPVVLATEDKMTETGLAEKEHISLEDFCTALTTQAEKTAADKNKAAFLTWTFSMSSFLLSSHTIHLDYMAKTVSIDREALQTALDAYGQIRNAGEKRSDILSNVRDGSEYGELVSFMGEEFDPVSQFGQFLVGYYNRGFHTSTFAVAGNDLSGYAGRVTLEAAINKNSKNIDDSFTFIREIMDGPAPKFSADDQYFKGLYRPYSVNIAQSSLYLTQTATNAGLKSLYIEDLCPCLENILANLEACEAWSYDVALILSNTLTPYLDGGQDFDACYDAMLNSLTLYITE